MRKVIKIASFTIVIVLILVIFTNSAYALTPEQLIGKTPNIGEVKDTGQKLITIFSVIGSFVSVIVLIFIGIKYMLGSVEEKANYKKTLLPYVIGAVLVFAGSSIAGIVYSFFK